MGGFFRAEVSWFGKARILVEYWSPGQPDEATLEALRKDTAGQLSDGAGENGFDFVARGRAMLLMPDLDGSPLSVEVVDDGKVIPPASRIAMSARDGDLTTLRKALALGTEDIDAQLMGCSGLRLAVRSGHVEAALLLIEHGANVHSLDFMGNSLLLGCAASRSLNDEDSARLTRALLSKGADPSYVGDADCTAMELAENRDKHLMMEVLRAFT